MKREQPDLLDVPNVTFLPSPGEMQEQRLDYIILVSRILVDHFSVLDPFKDVAVQHMPHKYMKEMSQKSVKVIYCPGGTRPFLG